VDGAALAELRSMLGDRLVERPEHLTRVSADASHLSCPPSACAIPRDRAEVQELVRWARRHRVPLVARGGGTSLDGESVPVPGSVVLDLSGWTAVHEIDPTDRIARVGPGVLNRSLQEAAAAHGLFFPPNPGSWRSSSIGGNASTNASGPRSFRYGPTRAWVRAAEVVLGTGETISVGGRSAKRSTGPDLLQMLLGSEGTLGIFTELTVGLAPLPPRRSVIAAPLPPSLSLGLVAAALGRGLPYGLSAIEYLDATCASALAATPGARLPGDRPLLLLEVESVDAEDELRRLAALSKMLRDAGVTEDPLLLPDADHAWTLRGSSGEALDRTLGPRIREDIGIPIGRIDEFLRAVERIASDAGVVSCVYGHLGEGSLHPNLSIPPGTPRGEEARGHLWEAALALGGTLSAEHGIGLVKAKAWSRAVGVPGRELLRAVKSACDPDGILNPGKVLPAPGASRSRGPSPSAGAGPGTPPG
jgi:FAD/FMN-containing dehydrogenase